MNIVDPQIVQMEQEIHRLQSLILHEAIRNHKRDPFRCSPCHEYTEIIKEKLTR